MQTKKLWIILWDTPKGWVVYYCWYSKKEALKHLKRLKQIEGQENVDLRFKLHCYVRQEVNRMKLTPNRDLKLGPSLRLTQKTKNAIKLSNRPTR